MGGEGTGTNQPSVVAHLYQQMSYCGLFPRSATLVEYNSQQPIDTRPRATTNQDHSPTPLQ